MLVWQKYTGSRWLGEHESALKKLAGTRLALITRPDRKRTVVEIAALRHDALRMFVRQFGGTIRKLSADWRCPVRLTKPIRVDPCLTIVNSRLQLPQIVRSRGCTTVMIPRSAAFGTGEHATTAMSLRMLARVSRQIRPGWRMLDLGTGSGILALAARRLGAADAIAVDSDPTALSVAAANARLNKIDRITFQCGDVRQLQPAAVLEVVAANLFSELLIEILPRLTAARWLILSGILRQQESEIRCGLERHAFTAVETRRRGKWVALLAQKAG